jgi:hypothetical protein
MTATSTLRFAGACAALAISFTCTAQAANTRSWVSRNGNDVMDCSIAHPCRTFQHAYDVTEAYGEVDVLDAGDYGPVTINRSIVIDGANLARIYANPGPVIKVGGSAHAVIRNLAIDGDQYSSQAMLWNGTGTLYLQNVNITGVGGVFVDSLLAFGPSPTPRRLYLEDVKMHNCFYGVEVFSTTGLLLPVMVSIKNSSSSTWEGPPASVSAQAV